MSDLPDRRLHAYRPDLAEEALRGRVEALAFVEGNPAMVTVPVVQLRPQPDLSASTDTELLLGETVRVLDVAQGWAWVKADRDDYVGYIPDYAVLPDGPVSTHIVTVPRSFVYSGPDLRFPTVQAVSMGCRLKLVGEHSTRGTLYRTLEDGSAVVAAHVAPLEAPPADDFVAVAARFLETPYLWGGRSGFGIDCSGLVQLSLMMAGHAAPRDTDMQEAGLGRAIAPEELRRGDLVFWKGHVAIMEDETTILHANGHSMTVAREPLEEAIGRTERLYGRPTGYRRPIG
ncbi:peptidase P60 [Xaviernesmea oryzae]|uniref:Peptidase P60 n=1 Tax=Xaviernesmea oryzae TaxID=464029 RepID=A0A1Q9AUE4_9HYPH|nr:NlpC/P60 family protein [Xaviernesmea oryzae]OLP59053.1 peptidase P60 [Xaviernesmea oryzae]SEK88885.1 NlpC/P60 family protein [Xaviernesmea oryzae]